MSSSNTPTTLCAPGPAAPYSGPLPKYNPYNNSDGYGDTDSENMSVVKQVLVKELRKYRRDLAKVEDEIAIREQDLKWDLIHRDTVARRIAAIKAHLEEII